MDSIVGHIYCPPDWDEARLCNGKDAEQIKRIAHSTFTDIHFVPFKNSIEITGDSKSEVFQAQNELNLLFFPKPIKAKKSWVRPDRPGQWGERRDSKEISR